MLQRITSRHVVCCMLLVGFAILYTRSWYRCDRLVFQRTDVTGGVQIAARKRLVLISSGNGAIVLTYYFVSAGVPLGFRDGFYLMTTPLSSHAGMPPTVKLLGVGVWRQEFSSGWYRAVSVSYWFAMSAIGCLLVVDGFVRSLIVRYRKRGLLCPRCGYDLRGSTVMCPECGDEDCRL